MNYTFQDRLVKEMREANICNTEDANIFLKEIFLSKFNAKFNVEPRENANLHIAPVNSTHFKEMKDEIEKLEEINIIEKDNEKKNKKTYFEIH